MRLSTNSGQRAALVLERSWKTKRMGKVDVTVLRLALYEMEYDDDIPTKVAILYRHPLFGFLIRALIWPAPHSRRQS